MNQRNCPNCGAPYKTELNTCPYCGTSYFDMSAIDISENKPFYLKLKMCNMHFTSVHDFNKKNEPLYTVEIKNDVD